MQVSPLAGGTTTPPAGVNTEPLGSAVALTATPNTGYIFQNWSGDVADANNPFTTVTMDAPQTVTANFVQSVACVNNLYGRGTPSRSCGRQNRPDLGHNSERARFLTTCCEELLVRRSLPADRKYDLDVLLRQERTHVTATRTITFSSPLEEGWPASYANRIRQRSRFHRNTRARAAMRERRGYIFSAG